MSRRRIIRDDDDEIRLADEEPHTEELGGGDEEPSATEQQRLRAEEEAHRRKARELAEKTARLQAELRAAVGQHEQEMNLAKVLSNRQKRLAPDPEPQGAPSAAARKPHQPLQPQVRALIVNSVLDEGMKWSEVSERFKVSKPTISRFVAAERRARLGEAPAETPKKRGRKAAITPEACVWLAQQIEQNAGVGLEALKEGLATEFDIGVEVAAISKTLATLKLTWKTVLPIPEKWNTPDVIAQRAAFIPTITEYLVRQFEFIYIDEQGYDLHKVRKTKGRALAGHPATVSVQPKGDRVSIIAALSKSGGMFFHHVVPSLGPKKRGVTGEDFDYFLNKLRQQLRKKPCVLIYDNAKIHHAEVLDGTIATLRDEGIEVLHLPPYSPWINAIEYAFNVLRTKISNRQFNGGKKELEAAIRAEARNITPEHAVGFFNKAQSYWEAAKLGMPFTGMILDPALPVADHHPAPAAAARAASAPASAMHV